MSNEQRRAAIGDLLLPEHEALIAECKADPNCTPGDAALRIAAAERARRTPTAAVLPFKRRFLTIDMVGAMAAWRAEWAANPALQREFVDADVYAHFKWAVGTGRTRDGAL